MRDAVTRDTWAIRCSSRPSTSATRRLAVSTSPASISTVRTLLITPLRMPSATMKRESLPPVRSASGNSGHRLAVVITASMPRISSERGGGGSVRERRYQSHQVPVIANLDGVVSHPAGDSRPRRYVFPVRELRVAARRPADRPHRAPSGVRPPRAQQARTNAPVRDAYSRHTSRQKTRTRTGAQAADIVGHVNPARLPSKDGERARDQFRGRVAT